MGSERLKYFSLCEFGKAGRKLNWNLQFCQENLCFAAVGKEGLDDSSTGGRYLPSSKIPQQMMKPKEPAPKFHANQVCDRAGLTAETQFGANF